MRVRRGVGVLMALAIGLGGASGISAQADDDGQGVLRMPAILIYGGMAGTAIDSVDAGPVIGVAVDLPLASWIILSPSLDRRIERWPDGDRPQWMLDFAFQAERRMGALRPYAGVALGAAFDFRDDRRISEEYFQSTYQAMGGVRWDLFSGLMVRGEARWRFFDGFEDGKGQVTAGLGWSF